MRTMEILCRRFERMNPGFECYLDRFDSAPGSYHVFVGNDIAGGWYWFDSVSAFRQWARYVVMD